MADVLELGRRVGPFTSRLGPELLRAYGDLVGTARGVPATAGALAIWDAQNGARTALVSSALQEAGAVHGEHDLVAHRPIEPGEELRTWVEGHGARPAGRNAAVTLRYLTLDADDRPVVEQWWTTVYRGATCAPVGAAAASPDPPATPSRAVGRQSVTLTTEMARRYAEVSGDWSPHHFETEAARLAGADRPFLHGLATMAIAAQVVTDLVAGGDPQRVRRVAVRFARPAPIGGSLDVDCAEITPSSFAFEGGVDTTPVLTRGRIELR